MSDNPYQSPSPSGIEPGGAGCTRAILTAIAILCWVLSALWAMFGLVSCFSVGASVMFEERPYFFGCIMVCVIVFPTTCVAMIGIASWRRSWRFVLYGLALLTPTAVLYGGLYFGLWGKLG